MNIKKFEFIAAALGMRNGCVDCPLEAFPPYLPDPCDTQVNQGGISGWVAVKCSAPFVDITDPGEWATKIAAGEVRGRLNGCRIKGGIPAPEYTEISRGACGTIETVSKTQTITLQDVENDPTFTAHTLYDYMDRRGDRWDMYFITCDLTIVGPYKNNGVKAYVVKPDTNEEDEYFEMVVTTKIPRGVFVPFGPLAFLETLSPGLNGV